MRQYEISVGEPWDFEGADGSNRVLVEGVGFVSGPKEPHWQPSCLLLRVQRPFTYGGDSVRLLVACPRYEGVTLESLERDGGTAAIARVRPNIDIIPGIPFGENDVEYFMIGTITPIRDALFAARASRASEILSSGAEGGPTSSCSWRRPLSAFGKVVLRGPRPSW